MCKKVEWWSVIERHRMTSTSPADIIIGAEIRVVANAGHFNHLMRVTAVTRDLFTMETASGARHMFTWNDLKSSDMTFYTRLDRTIKDDVLVSGSLPR
jgi:hypothetical protein